MVVFAGDVFPIELITHLPLLCEEKDVIYSYVLNRQVRSFFSQSAGTIFSMFRGVLDLLGEVTSSSKIFLRP